LYDEFIARLAEDSGVAIPYRRTGTLDVAADESELAGLKTIAGVLSRRNVPALLLDATTTRIEEPLLANDIAGGLLIEDHGFVGAGQLTRALVAAARRHGGQLVEQSRVRRIRQQGSEMLVDTDRGSLTSNTVVLAAGSWSGTIDIDGVTTRVPVRPVRG